MLSLIVDWFFHLDTHLGTLAANHGTFVYIALFTVIFIETGVVVMPFLPGDSLLFIAGALAAQQVLDLPTLLPLLIIAAIAGDTVNYAAGRAFRKHAVDTARLRLLKPEHIARTNSFFERHGRKTIVLARFVPVVRTLAPFIAALGQMDYRIFLKYNIIGAILWAVSLICSGYALGTLPVVSDHLTTVLLGIVLLSLLPGVFNKIGRPAKTAEKKDGNPLSNDCIQ